MNLMSICSSNALLPVRRKAITWIIADLLSNGPFKTTFNWTLNKNTGHFIHKKTFENVICEMVAILFMERWVKHLTLPTRTASLEISTHRVIHCSLDPQWLMPRYWWTFNWLNPVTTKFYLITKTIHFSISSQLQSQNTNPIVTVNNQN